MSNGKIIGRSPGSTIIRAYANGVSAYCKVTVVKPHTYLSNSPLNIIVGKNAQTILNVRGIDHRYRIRVSDNSVISIKRILDFSNNNNDTFCYIFNVCGLKPGTATIYAQANGITASCVVNVYKDTIPEKPTPITKPATPTPVPQNAKNTALSIYKKFLEKGSDGNYKLSSYLLLDVNKDGVPELYVKNVAPDKSFCTVRVYSIKNKKLFFCGDYYTKTQKNVLYHPDYKGVIDEWWTNSIGGSGVVMYGISLSSEGKGIVEKYKAFSSTRGYQTGTNMGNTTKSNFDAYVKKYFNSSKYKTYYYSSNTAENRNKMKF